MTSYPRHFLTPDTIPTGTTCRVLVIPDSTEWRQLVMGALDNLADPTFWEPFGAVTPDEAADRMLQMLVQAREACKTMVVGQIIQTISSHTASEGLLPLAGGTFNKSDYPELWEVMPAGQKTATTFTLWNLAGRMLKASGSGPLGIFTPHVEGGAQTVTLSVANLPAHNHTINPHSHSEVTAVPALINGGLEAPAAAAVPGAGVTGATSLTTNNTGSGTAVDIRDPFHITYFYIVAKP